LILKALISTAITFGAMMMFKLFFPSGKAFMTHPFDDDGFTDCFGVFGSSIYFAVDTTITIATFDSESRAYEVLDQIVNAYHAHKSFTLPEQ